MAPLAAQAPLAVGSTVAGRLTLADPRLPDGAPQRLYLVAAAAGDTLTLDLVSDDFDALVLVADTTGAPVAGNDNGGVACNARLTMVAPRQASYRVSVTASGPHGLGTFQLTLTRGTRPPPADTTCREFAGLNGVIPVGDSVTASLSSADPQFRDSTHFRRYLVPVAPNQTVTMDLVSDDFDAYLILERGRSDRLARSDDGGGGCHARLVHRAADDRPLVAVVNTAGRGQVGRYTLRVSDGARPLEPRGFCRFQEATVAAAERRGPVLPTPPPPPTAPARTIAPGQAALGAVTADDDVLPSDSTYAQAWTIEGRAGETVTIDLQSDEFDPFLYLDGPGLDRALQDDDSGGHCNARLTATFPQTGTYTIVVNTAVRGAVGRFTLSVTPGSKPSSLARCARLQ
jgi:serine protease Do